MNHRYRVGNILIFTYNLKFEIIEITIMGYKLKYIDKGESILEEYPQYFVEGEEFTLSLSSLLKEL